MIHLVDKVIERVLDSGWPTTPPPVKPGFYFTIPDEAWRAQATGGLGDRLNIYLFDVRENRDFRRPEWDLLELPDRTSVRSQPPVYFDCHYLISAWNPAEDSEMLAPIIDEHALLSEALRIILRNPDVSPSALGVGGGGPVFQQSHVYLSLAPPEAPRVLNDFWSTMKVPWRLAIQLVVTAPLDLLKDSEPSVPLTTFVQRYVLMSGGGIEERVHIGGWVLRRTGGLPIVGATVERMSGAGEVLEAVVTDSQGRYVFSGLRPGPHPLHVRAAGFTPIDRILDIPAGPPVDHVFELV